MAASTTGVPNDGGHPNFSSQHGPMASSTSRESQQQQQQPPYYGMQQQQAGPYGQPLHAPQPQAHYHPQAVGSQYPIPPPSPNGPFSRPGIGIQSLQQLPPQEPQFWTTGIFDCFDDTQSCFVTAFLPCVTYGQIAEILDIGTTSCSHAGVMYGVILGCFAVPCFYSYTARAKLRVKYALPEDPMNDLCTHVLCEPFALCQEYRELKNRGIDPALGWTGYQIKQNQEMMMAAPGTPSMSK